MARTAGPGRLSGVMLALQLLLSVPSVAGGLWFLPARKRGHGQAGRPLACRAAPEVWPSLCAQCGSFEHVFLKKAKLYPHGIFFLTHFFAGTPA